MKEITVTVKIPDDEYLDLLELAEPVAKLNADMEFTVLDTPEKVVAFAYGLRAEAHNLNEKIEQLLRIAKTMHQKAVQK